RHQLVAKNPALTNVQPARTNPDHSRAWFNADQLVTLLVKICERAAQRFENVFYAQPLMLPLINGRIFKVEHHAGGARVKHLDHKLGGIRRASHLVALVLTPFRQLDLPSISDCRARMMMGGFVSLE